MVTDEIANGVWPDSSPVLLMISGYGIFVESDARVACNYD